MKTVRKEERDYGLFRCHLELPGVPGNIIIDVVVLHAGTTDDIEALSGELFGHIEVAGSFILVVPPIRELHGVVGGIIIGSEAAVPKNT